MDTRALKVSGVIGVANSNYRRSALFVVVLHAERLGDAIAATDVLHASNACRERSTLRALAGLRNLDPRLNEIGPRRLLG